ncbi:MULTISPECIES: SoxY-related AACIE arm protein [unclassified Polaromonas]|uniref:SoxY-related AACIE arm protein n=1 Tax=unclassified Polaromonas TaxID=2638319 RepID=UPI000F08B766|nr:MULTISPECIES: SoxY-related AACIE arm protein [unclassified Polaromonas]AYQ29817.1 SoxY-related AACIE arm protein [Polaromonas sp. SP1]QGJ19066.1 SoxY-related AACIE arm protein [Polaromonas sp. Pch-P]
MTTTDNPHAFKRRRILAGAAGMGLSVVFRPAAAQADELAAAVAAYAQGAPVRAGKVKLDVAELVDNGNVVPITVTVESPMTAADHVKGIAVFNAKNPQRDVARFTLGPRAGKASVTTRIRLATSQQLVAVAQMSDGSYWSHTVNVIVTLAACIEGDI